MGYSAEVSCPLSLSDVQQMCLFGNVRHLVIDTYRRDHVTGEGPLDSNS
jgi:hypothetical protein